MIISASRRTDIPAFYMPWMLERLRRRWCRVVNPFNAAQQRLVSLEPGEVDAFVFWTRDPGELAAALPRLRALGAARVAALVTLTDYGRALEPHLPSGPRVRDGLHRLADALGRPGAVRWRYDPILFGPGCQPEDHRRRFEDLCRSLARATEVVIVSLVNVYAKTRRRTCAVKGFDPGELEPKGEVARRLIADLGGIARAHGMRLQTCCEDPGGPAARQPSGACIDPLWLSALFPARSFERLKDPGQREHCHCALSIDVGAPDTCLHGCVYCYAVRGQGAARAAYARHDPGGDALLPVQRSGALRAVGSVPAEAWEGAADPPERIEPPG